MPYDYFVCAKCGHSSEPYSSSRNVSIISNGDNLILECQVLYLGETGYVHITPATRKTVICRCNEVEIFYDTISLCRRDVRREQRILQCVEQLF